MSVPRTIGIPTDINKIENLHIILNGIFLT